MSARVVIYVVDLPKQYMEAMGSREAVTIVAHQGWSLSAAVHPP